MLLAPAQASPAGMGYLMAPGNCVDGSFGRRGGTGENLDLFVGSAVSNSSSQDATETFVMCQVLSVKPVLLWYLHLWVAADYLGLFILLLFWELKKKKERIVN